MAPSPYVSFACIGMLDHGTSCRCKYLFCSPLLIGVRGRPWYSFWPCFDRAIWKWKMRRSMVPFSGLYSSIIAARWWSDRSLETFSCVIIQEGDPNVVRCFDPLLFWSWIQQRDRSITHTAHYSHSQKIWDGPSNVAHVHSGDSRVIRFRWTAKIPFCYQRTVCIDPAEKLSSLSIWYFWYGIWYNISRFAYYRYSGSVPY